MRQAISTRYIGPTNFRGSRIKATSGGGLSITLHWDYAFNSENNHATAAYALADKYGWAGQWFGGATADGYAWVCVADHWVSADIRHTADQEGDMARGYAFVVAEAVRS